MEINEHLNQSEAEHLGRELQRLACAQARLDHDFCDLVARFDESQAIGWFQGVKSTAHFLAFACSMSPGVAREHVRVARALRVMPATDQLFADGQLSYSKVRELTRLVGQVDETQLLELALEQTASQLARTVSSYRTAAGTRVRAEQKRRFSAQPTGDGMVRLSICLPAEDAALVSAAVEAATRRPAADVEDSLDVPAGTPRIGARTPGIDQVQGLVDVASAYLDALPGEPADDHTVVIVHVAAEQLAANPLEQDQSVPAGTPLSSDVGTNPLRSGACHVGGHGPVEAATAQRLTCTSRLVGAIVDQHGDVLALGRTTRLVSRRQRRALQVRDHGVCQFPGCTQTRHLDAHHLLPWSAGGATDLANLMLLCRRHHTLTHEGQLTITRTLDLNRFHFALPDGLPITGTWRAELSADDLAHVIASYLAESERGLSDSDVKSGSKNESDDGSDDKKVAASTQRGLTDPTRITPRNGGAGFSLAECVRVLFDSQFRDRAA